MPCTTSSKGWDGDHPRATGQRHSRANGTAGRDMILSTLDAFDALDVEEVLRKGGLLDDDLAAIRDRLLP